MSNKKDKHMGKGPTMGGQQTNPNLGAQRPTQQQPNLNIRPDQRQQQGQPHGGFNKPSANQPNANKGWGGHNSGQHNPHDKHK